MRVAIRSRATVERQVDSVATLHRGDSTYFLRYRLPYLPEGSEQRMTFVDDSYGDCHSVMTAGGKIMNDPARIEECRACRQDPIGVAWPHQRQKALEYVSGGGEDWARVPENVRRGDD
jgi:hypothetical protein